MFEHLSDPNGCGVSRRLFLLSSALIGSVIWLPGTSIAKAAEGGIRFFVIGDWGHDGAADQREVATSMKQKAKVYPPNFVISVGDNFYSDGVTSITDSHWSKSFERLYDSDEFNCPWYAVLGNHDWRGNLEAELNFSQLDPRWKLASSYYLHREYLNSSDAIDFFFLDTTAIVRENWIEAFFDKQLPWLESQLAKSDAKWKIVAGHHTIYSSGKHGRTSDFADHVEPLLERYAVDAYLCGHDHHLEHISHNGVEYFVVGASGSTAPVDPDMVTQNASSFATSELGFASIDIQSDQLLFDFISSGGALLYRAEIARSG